MVLQHYMILRFVSKILCPGMSLTCLNVQEDKSEIIHFSFRFSLANSVPTIKVGYCSVAPRNKVKDLGDKLVCHLTFKIHINICCSTSHSIHHVRKIMKFLSRSATERAVSSMHLFLQYLVSAAAFFMAFPPTS